MKFKSLSYGLFFYPASENFLTEKIKKIDILLVFLTILLSGGATQQSPPLFRSLTIITLILALVLLFKKNKVNKYSLRNFFITLCVVLFIFLIKYLFQSEFQNIDQYGYRFINIIIALVVLLYFSSNPVYINKCIYIALFFIMLHALLSFLAWYLVKNNLKFEPSINKDTFYYIFYYLPSSHHMNAINFSFFSFFRMSGIFWEPGVLQIYINILLFMSLFIYVNSKIAFLSIIVILTTWSSTGLVILFLQLFFVTFQKKNRRNIWKAVVLLAGVALMLIPLKDNLTNKFEGDAATAGSSYARALDTLTAINIIKNNPLLGIDLDFAVYEKERLQNKAVINAWEYSYDEREAADTNSVLNYAVFFGIPLVLLIMHSLYYQNIFSKNKFVFFLIIVTAMLTEPIGFLVFPLILIFSNFILKNNKKTNTI